MITKEKTLFYLASQSPRRFDLLRQVGIEPVVVITEVQEKKEGQPSFLVAENAYLKAQAAAQKIAGRQGIVIAADTVVSLDEHILGKPRDEKEAFFMLQSLSGRKHAVYSGLALWNLANGEMQKEWLKTEVTFRNFSDEEIKKYMESGEPMDKAGAYGIQGKGALLVEGICGDYFNVVGLPLQLLQKMLLRWQISLLA